MQTKHITTIIMLLLSMFYATKASALACGDFVYNDVTLTANLECTTGYRALEVIADNVTIDLNGFIISGDRSSVGIIVRGYNNVTIINGAMTGFWLAIDTINANQLKVNNIMFYEVGTGVSITQGNKAIVQHNDFIRTRGYGVTISNHDAKFTANYNTIDDNEFYQAQFGISICGDQADENMITNNLLWKTVDYAIHLNNADRNTVRNNRVLESSSTVLRVNSSSLNNIESNSFIKGEYYGISILTDASNPCLLGGSTHSYKNTISGNHSIGFITGVSLGLGRSKNANVYSNTITGNKLYDNRYGIIFSRDAHYNNANGNAFQGTVTEIVDEGVGNWY